MLWVGNLARLQPGEQVLDVGCGTKILAVMAKKRGGETGRVRGIDPSVPMIARARRRAARRGTAIDFPPAVIERLPYPEQTFDVVLSTFMLHQIPDDVKRQGLAELARVLKPGGRLLVVATRRPAEHTAAGHDADARAGHPVHPVHGGSWNSGVQDQPALLRAAGCSDIETGDLPGTNTLLPEGGFAIGPSENVRA
jgi:ubiquinone/menaquinone biosynthesis C-methylase UbiE